MEAANAPGSSSSQPPAATVTSQTGSRSGGQQPKQQQKRNRETQTNSDLLNISEPGPSTSKVFIKNVSKYPTGGTFPGINIQT